MGRSWYKVIQQLLLLSPFPTKSSVFPQIIHLLPYTWLNISGFSSPFWRTPHRPCWRLCPIGALGWQGSSPAGNNWRSIPWWLVFKSRCVRVSEKWRVKSILRSKQLLSQEPPYDVYIYVVQSNFIHLVLQRKVEESSSGELESGTFGNSSSPPAEAVQAGQNHYWAVLKQFGSCMQ